MTAVSRFYERQRDLLNFLGKQGEVSFQTDIQPGAAKALVIAAASEFEVRILELLANAFRNKLGADSPLFAFAERRAVRLKYHNLFEWTGTNANKFLSFFGAPFQQRAAETIRKEAGLREAIRDFIQIGSLRNGLAHQDFVTYPLEKTLDEVFALYNSASAFVSFLEEQFLPAEIDSNESAAPL
jgi:hypothetical protein